MADLLSNQTFCSDNPMISSENKVTFCYVQLLFCIRPHDEKTSLILPSFIEINYLNHAIDTYIVFQIQELWSFYILPIQSNTTFSIRYFVLSGIFFLLILASISWMYLKRLLKVFSTKILLNYLTVNDGFSKCCLNSAKLSSFGFPVIFII